MFKRLFSARRWLALCGLVTVLILAFLAVISPQQLPVIAYKAGLVSFAAHRRGSTGPFSLCPTVGVSEKGLAPRSRCRRRR
ncbi:MAG: putative holin [Bilophila wadsworthia]